MTKEELRQTMMVCIETLRMMNGQTPGPDELPVPYCQCMALGKALHCVLDAPDPSSVIGSDTTVICEGRVLGKPKDEAEAAEMLRFLSGKTHEVYTGVAIVSKDVNDCFTSVTKVEFYELSDEEIDWYISTREPMDKAGAYGIQGFGCRLVKRIEGDYFTVMGLPVSTAFRPRTMPSVAFMETHRATLSPMC